MRLGAVECESYSRVMAGLDESDVSGEERRSFFSAKKSILADGKYTGLKELDGVIEVECGNDLNDRTKSKSILYMGLCIVFTFEDGNELT